MTILYVFYQNKFSFTEKKLPLENQVKKSVSNFYFIISILMNLTTLHGTEKVKIMPIIWDEPEGSIPFQNTDSIF